MSDVSTTKFSMIPKWVMISDLSSGAIRLYGVLMCYADNKTHEAYPSRKTLADDMQLKRVRSVDTYIEELVEFGALIVNKRKRKDGSYMSSLYTLIFDKSMEQVREEPEGVVLKNALPSAPDVTVTRPTQLDPLRSTVDESTRELHPHSKERGLASKPDPISPAFHDSPDRQRLLQRVGRIAYAKANDYPELDYWNLVADFSCDIETTFPDTECADHLIYDRGWVPPKKAVNKFEAAKWLNMFLNALRIEGGDLKYRPAA